MAESTFRITGRGGRLRAGARPAGALGPWRARHVDGARWQFEFEAFEPDLYWDPERASYVAVLPVGRTELRGSCTVVGTDPLILEMEIPP